MKKWSKLLSVPVAVALLAACGNEEATEDTTEDVTEETAVEEEETTEETSEDEATDEEAEDEEAADEEEDTADAETGASVVQGPEDAQRAMSAEEGEWIVILEEDMEVEEDLVLEQQDDSEGEGGERKLAFYTSDEDDNVELFTLTVPSITIEHENVRFAGRVVGDVIVDANDFSFYNDPEIDGDLIFTSPEYEESAEYDESSVSGEVIVEGEEGAEEDAE